MIAKDLSGLRFGSLVAVRRVENKGKSLHAMWLCCCDCGEETVVESSKLGRQTVSCPSCVYKKRSSDYTEDLAGQRFGKLTAIEETGRRVSAWHVWKCVCDCGKTIEAASGNLKSGHVKSCGCLGKEYFVDHTSIPAIKSKVIHKSNTSGIRGVCFDKRSGKWLAYIGFKKKIHRLGSFYSIEDARKARAYAEETMYEPFLREVEEKDKEKAP